jgi:hypothetical protein
MAMNQRHCLRIVNIKTIIKPNTLELFWVEYRHTVFIRRLEIFFLKNTGPTLNVQAPSSETAEHSSSNPRSNMKMKAVGSHETIQLPPSKHGLP